MRRKEEWVDCIHKRGVTDNSCCPTSCCGPILPLLSTDVYKMVLMIWASNSMLPMGTLISPLLGLPIITFVPSYQMTRISFSFVWLGGTSLLTVSTGTNLRIGIPSRGVCCTAQFPRYWSAFCDPSHCGQ